VRSYGCPASLTYLRFRPTAAGYPILGWNFRRAGPRGFCRANRSCESSEEVATMPGPDRPATRRHPVRVRTKSIPPAALTR